MFDMLASAYHFYTPHQGLPGPNTESGGWLNVFMYDGNDAREPVAMSDTHTLSAFSEEEGSAYNISHDEHYPDWARLGQIRQSLGSLDLGSLDVVTSPSILKLES